MENRFTVTFGQMPTSYIERTSILERICNDFALDFPLSHTYIISGVRGSGKTVLLTEIAKKLSSDDQWVVVDINPNREILEQIASGIYDNGGVKHLFIKESFSFSFHGFGFSIEGETPVSNIKTVLEKMLDVLKKNNKKLLIAIDEATNNQHMRSFAHDYQSLLRNDYPVYAIMTGLYENVSSLLNSKNITFLYRTPKFNLDPLKLEDIEKGYSLIFKNDPPETITTLAELTKGYAFAYQIVGYLYMKYKRIDAIYAEMDQYLSSYVYEKIWANLPHNEKLFLAAFNNESTETSDLLKAVPFDKKSFSVYRDRLIKRGLITSEKVGNLTFVLPRFLEFIQRQ